MPAPEPLVVYVLDDDAAVRAGLCRYIRAAGLRERACATGEELLAALGQGGRACVLFDLSAWHGPGTLGARLRERGLDVPLIAVSGRADGRAAAEARAAGASLLFHKPVDGRALVDAIEWMTSEETA